MAPHREWTFAQKKEWALRNGIDMNLPNAVSGKTR
jgi:hypothetical protein